MQIEVNQLASFVDKATLSCSIPNFLIIVKDKKIRAITKDPANAAATDVTLNITTDDDMRLPVKDSRFLANALALFDGKVEFVRNENVLSIYNKTRQVDIILADESYVECAIEALPAKITHDASVELDVAVFKNAIKNAAVTRSDGATITLNKTQLIVTTGEKNFDKIKETIPAIYPYEVEARYSKYLFSVMNVINGKMKMSIKSDYPVKIEEKTADITAIYIVAPLVDNDGK